MISTKRVILDSDIVRQHADALGLGNRLSINFLDQLRLKDSLKLAGQWDLAEYVEDLKSVRAFEDFLTNIVYQN